MRERGLRASDVAARVGQPVSVVSNELSRGLTSVPSVAKYARALRVPVWELLHKPVVSAMGKELAAWSEPSDDKGAPTRIGAIMRERGLTQLHVAERMGAIRQNVNKWVTSTKLNLSTLQAIATALEIDDEHLYLLFISQADYDAEMERRASLDPAMMAEMERMQRAEKRNASFGLLQPVRPMVEAETEEPVFAPDTNDLFANYPSDMSADEMYQMELIQIEEEERRKKDAKIQEVQMQEGVTYVCGNTRITIVNGVMEIRVQDKKKYNVKRKR